jgi:diaminopimelate epimerase
MKEIAFSKMTGLGNDFIFIDNLEGNLENSLNEIIKYIPKLCKRGLSIGADGFVILEKSTKANFAWQFYNSDGSQAEMCGNAARCASKYAYLNGIAGEEMTFETTAGIIRAEIVNELLVKAQLTQPSDIKTGIYLDDLNLHLSSINTGVPHTVVLLENLENIDVLQLGNKIRNHKYFAPKGTNVNFCKILDRETIEIRTYERGVEAETLACGTGALASAVISHELKMTDYPIKVKTKGGGIIKIYFENNNYFIEAEARLVYRGFFNREAYIY